MQTSGWGAPQIESEYARVRELSEVRGPGAPLLSALWNLWIYTITRGELDQAQAFTDRLFALAERSRDRTSLLQAHHARWSTLFTVGDLSALEHHTAQGLELCAGSSADRGNLAYGSHDTGICARMFRARTLALRGQVDSAAALCDSALLLARELDHPFTLAFTLMHAAAVHETRRDAERARTHANEAWQVAEERGFGLMLAWSRGFLGFRATSVSRAE